MNNIMSFIFLDVDGPINPDCNKHLQSKRGKSTSSYYIKLPSKQLSLLKKIIDNTGANIVLSSKWRLRASDIGNNKYSPARINLEKQLNTYGMTIYDETPFVDNIKGLEVSKWLAEFSKLYHYTPPYVILEDNIDDYITRYHHWNYVHCDSNYGMGEKEANIAVNILLNQMEQINQKTAM